MESIRFDLDDIACPSIDCDVEYSNVFTPMEMESMIYSDPQLHVIYIAIDWPFSTAGDNLSMKQGTLPMAGMAI